MANKTNMVSKLPAIFQTVTERKFFDATFDQVFSSKNSERTTGFIGRRIAGEFDPINDYYLPEPDKERTWYQLEPTVVSKDNSTLEKTNRYFYTDIIDRIRYYGGNVGNHDRLFSSKYYSYAPPIDVDKFVNYQNYYWLPDGLPIIELENVTDDVINNEIIGQLTYNTSQNEELDPAITPENVEFTNGMRIKFVGNATYSDDYYTIEGVGDAIFLVEEQLEILSIVDPVSVSEDVDYITMERGSIDNNAWSRTNKWYPLETIGKVINIALVSFPVNSSRALRPILEFERDLELYNSGTSFTSYVQYFAKASIDDTCAYTDINDQLITYVVAKYPWLTDWEEGQTIVLPCDSSTIAYDGTTDEIVNSLIFNLGVSDDGLSFSLKADSDNAIIAQEGDTIIVDYGEAPFNGGQYGMTYYYSDGMWNASTNRKTNTNQPIEFALYDTDFNSLGDDSLYPGTDFNGSEIFSYSLDNAPDAYIDPVLGLPITYRSLGQLSDIIFNNDLQSDRYNYVVNNSLTPIDGYYYFKKLGEEETYSNSWYPAEDVSKQRVLDRFTVFDTEDTDFFLSVLPLNNDIVVTIDGEETENFTVINRTDSGINEVVLRFHDTKFEQDAVIEALSYTYEMLPDEERGYFEIPQQLDANPNNEEVSEQSYSDFVPHFTSIMSGQATFDGEVLGFNNFGDTAKDPSKGTYILQNETPLLKTMLTASEDSLDNVKATRFANNEYVNFKSKFLKVARQLDLSGYDPALSSDEIKIDLWMEEIFNILTLSKEFSESFAYSYMLSRTDLFSVETKLVDNITADWTLFPDESLFVDLSDPKNTVYLYKVKDENDDSIIDDALLLLADVDYTIDLETATITWTENTKVENYDVVVARIYENTPPAYLPATPAKLGIAPVFIPAIEIDTTFTDPLLTIVGHDGSRSPVYGKYDNDASVEAQRLIPADDGTNDIRDNVLFELEKRIYNGIDPKFTTEEPLLPIATIRPGYFRSEDVNRYSREEYYTITESFISRWTAENKADYRLHEFYDIVGWKTWNYSSQQYNGEYLPGHWKGIFLYFYDTIRPDTHPWEMLGHSVKPIGWDDMFADANEMWAYIETGGDNPELYARTGLSNILPVDTVTNEIRSIVEIFNLATDPGWPFTNELPFPEADGTWVYGDGAPVEAAWYDSSEFKFSETEFLYLMKPAAYSEKFWDPSSITVLETGNGDTQTLDLITDERNKNSVQIVHGEKFNDILIYRPGYQQWITDRLLFLNKNITTNFGDRVRNIAVNLGHKMAAFTDKDTISIRLSSSSTESDTGNLTVPTTNYDVNLHTSPSIRDYVYSGVIIRADANGTFRVYGYDLLDQTFRMLPAKAGGKSIQFSQGGTPASFREFNFGETYAAGEYVRYQNKFYQCKISHTADTFLTTNWTKLSKLPEVGGVSVSYRPDREEEPVLVPYGSALRNSQDVFDFLIGYGAWLEHEGWIFENINGLNQVEDWKHAGNQFLFWVVNDWQPDNVLILSPGSTQISLEVETGYPMNVERMTNDVYSIMGKYGFAIDPRDTTINRNNKLITVVPTAGDTGVYYFRVSSAETEHVVMFDNITEFNDTIYNPLLRVRQDRLKFTGTRTLDWFGKMEAGGYLIQNDGLIQNFENLTHSITEYYNTETALDEPEVDLAVKHLVGYENKEYLDELEVSDDVQFNFYQGYIREKGSLNSVSKILRSNAIQDKQDITFFEEWAFKLQDFAGSAENVTIEFVSDYNDVIGDPQTYRLNHVRSETGYIKDIVLFDVSELYNEVPDVFISVPDQGGTRAEAIVILGDDKKIASIDILNAGSGYIGAPEIAIYRKSGIPSEDKAYAVYQAEITHDTERDSIIDIDIDDSDTWILRPEDEMALPMTDNIDYQIPNAGYVHKEDVDWLAFDTDVLIDLWTKDIVPQLGETIWVAKNDREDWGVYEVIDNGAVSNLRSGKDEVEALQSLSDVQRSVRILDISTIDIDESLEDIAETQARINLLEETITTAESEKKLIEAQVESTDVKIHENVIAIQQASEEDVALVVAGTELRFARNNYIQGEFDGATGALVTEGITHKNDTIRIAKQELAQEESTLDKQLKELAVLVGEEVTEEQLKNVETIVEGDLAIIDVSNSTMITDTTVLSQNRRYLETHYSYSTSGLVLNDGLVKIKHELVNPELDDEVVSSVVTIYKYITPEELDTGTYLLANMDGELVSYSEEFGDYTDAESPLEVRVSYALFQNRRFKDSGDIIDTSKPSWIDNNGDWKVLDADGNEKRRKAPLINTKLFENAFLRDPVSGSTSMRLPVYDPFKGILAGPADQNIDFKAHRDPARYNVSDDAKLYDPSNMFDADQVGMLWWDMSNIRYLYYEQPGEDTEILEYRRNNWGKVFPGSTADIYEWVESTRPPNAYQGTGTPRSETEYVKIETYNTSLGTNIVKYYFWVKDTTEVDSNRANRTISALAVSGFVLNPKSMAYSWFTPVQENDSSSSFVIANADSNLSNNTNIVQVNYKTREGANDSSAQWVLLREGDRFSIVPDELWDKMVNSLVGYTDILPDDSDLVDENGVQIPPIYSKGIKVDDGYVLPVPDPSLSASEQRGIGIRPQQTMYVDIFGARKVMYLVVNDLLSEMKMWTDQFDGWDEVPSSSDYWNYVDWYEEDYDSSNTNAKKQVANYNELFTIKDSLIDGELVKVYPFVPIESDRYEIYEYSADDDQYTLVRRQNGTIALDSAIYTDAYSITLRNEIRDLLTTLKDNVFIKEYTVNENLLFFAMVNYSFSEQRNIDWAFKTTYISFLQDNVILSQRPNYESDVLGEFISYVNEVKPYHTKLRDAVTVLTSTQDLAPGTAFDDAIGDFVCELLPDPIPDPVYPGEEITHSCRWVDDSITENLRYFDVTIEFARVTCDEESPDYQPGTVCKKMSVFREGTFIDKLDVLTYDDEGILLDSTLSSVDGYERDGNERYIIGEPVKHELSAEKWDTSSWDNDPDLVIDDPDYVDPDPANNHKWDATEVTLVRYQNPDEEADENFQDTEIDSSKFAHPDGSPEEQVRLNPTESIVINAGYGVAVMEELTDQFWDFEPYDTELYDPFKDSGDPGANLTGSAYRINITPTGWVEYTRFNANAQTTLEENIDTSSTTIKVADTSVLVNPDLGAPGVVWIDNERIEYLRVVDGNTLIDIQRGTHGTVPVTHIRNTVVYDGTSQQVVRNADATPIDGVPVDPNPNNPDEQYFYEMAIPTNPDITEEIQLSTFDPWFKKLWNPDTSDYYRASDFQEAGEEPDDTIVLFENSPQAEFILANNRTNPNEV